MGIDSIYLLGVWEIGTFGVDMDRKNDYSKILPDVR